MHDVANAFNMKALDIKDDPIEVKKALQGVFSEPILIIVNTHRKFWHSGAGIDDINTFDSYEFEKKDIGPLAEEIDVETKKRVESLWQKQLEIL